MKRAPLTHTIPSARSLLLLAPLLVALQACCGDEPREALRTPPDRECQTGVEVGLDIAVWECVNEEHVVAYRESSAFGGCSDVTVERVPCGELTAFERTRADSGQPVCTEP